MISDTLKKVFKSFETRPKVALNITVSGLDLKTRRRVVKILKRANWEGTTPPELDFSGGFIHSEDDPSYKYADITIYLPDKPDSDKPIVIPTPIFEHGKFMEAIYRKGEKT